MKLLLVFFLQIPLTLCNPKKVFENKDDLSSVTSDEVVDSRAVLANSSIFGHKEVTICTRFLVLNFGTETSFQAILGLNPNFMPLLTYTMSTARDDSTDYRYMAGKKWLNGNILGASVINNKRHGFSIEKLIPRVWNHACFVASSIKNFVKIVVNGEVVFEDTTYQGGHENAKEDLSIMGMQGYEYALFGKITDVNIWNRCLQEDEVKSWTSCEKEQSGNILDWNKVEVKYLKGLEEVMLEQDEVCKEKAYSQHLIISTHLRDFEKTLLFCEDILKGQIAIPSDNATFKQIKSEVKSMVQDSETCDKIFTGHRKMKGKFRNIYTNQEIPFKVEMTEEEGLECSR